MKQLHEASADTTVLVNALSDDAATLIRIEFETQLAKLVGTRSRTSKCLDIRMQITFQNDVFIVSYWHELTIWSENSQNLLKLCKSSSKGLRSDIFA